MGFLLATSVFFISPLAAQTIGGASELLDQWRGITSEDYLSGAPAGDVNADGREDIFLNSATETRVISGSDGATLFTWLGNFSSCAKAGDVNADGVDDILLGDHSATVGGFYKAGSAYVYSGADGSLLYQWDGQKDYDYLGEITNGVGDLNLDGYADVAIRSAVTSFYGMNGAVQVFSGFDGTRLYYWDWAAAFGSDEFGASIAPIADTNNDGFDDLLIGAPELGPDYAGIAFLYSGRTGAVLRQWEGGGGRDAIGKSVSATGDLDFDGVVDILVGGSGVKVNGVNSGAVFVFSGATGDTIMEFFGAVQAGAFGSSVASGFDMDGDGVEDIVVGSPATNRLNRIGAASVYSGLTGELIRRWSGEELADEFGAKVFGFPDFNQDGYDDILISAIKADDSTGLIDVGYASMYSFHPLLVADVQTMSASLGGSMHLDLDFPDLTANWKYRVLASFSGIGPTQLGTIQVPLTMDWLAADTYRNQYPISTTSTQGFLDPEGKATAQLQFPTTLPPQLIGRSLIFAATANQLGQLPEYSSVAVTLGITP